MSFVTYNSINAQVKSPLKKIVNATVLSTLGTMLCFTSSALAQQLSGIVLSKQGKPINNAIVELDGDSQQVRTDSQDYLIFQMLKKTQWNFMLALKTMDIVINKLLL